MTERLVFVYNANAGLIAGALDSIHKTLSPGTYGCNLCALTYGALTMRSEWRNWLKSISLPADFYHLPDFRSAFPEFSDEPLPLVGTVSKGRLSVLMSSDALSQIKSVDELIEALQSQLSLRL